MRLAELGGLWQDQITWVLRARAVLQAVARLRTALNRRMIALGRGMGEGSSAVRRRRRNGRRPRFELAQPTPTLAHARVPAHPCWHQTCLTGGNYDATATAMRRKRQGKGPSRVARGRPAAGVRGAACSGDSSQYSMLGSAVAGRWSAQCICTQRVACKGLRRSRMLQQGWVRGPDCAAPRRAAPCCAMLRSAAPCCLPENVEDHQHSAGGNDARQHQRVLSQA